MLRYNGDVSLDEPGFDGRGGSKGFTGLHGAAFFEIMEIVVALLAMGECDINVMDNMGRMALAWAAVGGYEDVVGILLERRDAKADATDTLYSRNRSRGLQRRGIRES